MTVPKESKPRYLALVSDYDGTLTPDGRLNPSVLRSLQQVRESGIKVILLTGRELPDLLSVLPEIAFFDRVVAENGAVLYRPAGREEKLLAEPPPSLFIQTLRERGVKPLSQGRIVISTRHPQETAVLEVIRELGLELTLSFNKGAVMILPSGVNKESGLRTVLDELGIPAQQTVGVGDGENDHSFLKACGFSVAVANAIPMLKAYTHLVTSASDGKGVQELVSKLLSNTL